MLISRHKQIWQNFRQTNQKKNGGAQINKIRGEKKTTTDTTETQRCIWDFYKELYGNKMTFLLHPEEMDEFLENYNFPRQKHTKKNRKYEHTDFKYWN